MKKEKQKISNELKGESSPNELATAELVKLVSRYQKKYRAENAALNHEDAKLFMNTANVLERVLIRLIRQGDSE